MLFVWLLPLLAVVEVVVAQQSLASSAVSRQTSDCSSAASRSQQRQPSASRPLPRRAILAAQQNTADQLYTLQCTVADAHIHTNTTLCIGSSEQRRRADSRQPPLVWLAVVASCRAGSADALSNGTQCKWQQLLLTATCSQFSVDGEPAPNLPSSPALRIAPHASRLPSILCTAHSVRAVYAQRAPRNERAAVCLALPLPSIRAQCQTCDKNALRPGAS